ncbi:phosphoglucosamine mutase [Candidatus Marinamargulisbacteria bacterium SCGC AG-333-B06]|nr:phosphoglucosamine mutase [Candidatus Marinamargulisbacteria bacterium SCGC AG-333-B06]
MTSLMVSSSGIRGIVGDSLTPNVALSVGASFGAIIGKGPVILGGDTRISYDCITASVLAGLLSVGTDVIQIGAVPTPTVQQLIKMHNAKGGLVITASHNPIMWNGIKLMNETGSFLSDDQYDQFISTYESNNYVYKPYHELGVLTHDHDAIEKHIDLILSKIDVAAIQNSGLHVLVDANNGTGALADPILLDKLGINYTILNEKPDGNFSHDPEPLEKNLSQIKEELVKGDYDIGFVQDADADRLVILDEHGRFIGEDYSLALCIDYVLSYEKDHASNKDVVVNLSTSNVITDIVQSKKGTIHQTRIGEPNVTAKLKELNAIVGGEGNGGVIYPAIGWGRDSLVGIVLALNYLAKSKQTVSEIVASYPRYTMLREKLQVSDHHEIPKVLDKIKDYYATYSLNQDDGIKVIMDSGWIHVRPSNTEPIIRIFIEQSSPEKAKRLLKDVLSLTT